MDIPLLYWFAGVLTVPLALFYFQWKRRKAPALPLPLPPGPAAWHIVANLFQLCKKPHEAFCAFSLKYGPLMSIRLGVKTIVVVSSPAMAKEILKTHDHIFVGRTIIETAKVFSHHKSSLLWGDYGPHWRYLRRISSVELFSPRRLEALQHLRRDQVFHTIRLIFESKGKAVNIPHMAFCNTVNVLGNMIFGTSLFHPYDPVSVELKDILWKIVKLTGTPDLSDFYPLVRLLDPQGMSRQKATHLKRLYDFLDVFIQDRLTTKNIKIQQDDSDKDFLDVLLDARTEEFTLFDARVLIAEIFIGGSDSTTTAIEWVMAELIRNPHKMKRVQQELDEVVGRERRVEGYEIDGVPYLHATVKETFRLHPPLPLLIPHKAMRDCEIGEFMIPRNTDVMVNVWAIGRDPQIWKEPLQFMPERFLEGQIDVRGHDFELIPFGAGRRTCLGLPLGIRMVHLILAAFIHSFEWTLPHGMTCEQMEMSDDFALILRKTVELNAVAIPRLPHQMY